MNNKIGVIVPYFGELPGYFEIFLDSCISNKDIDFHIFTNNKLESAYPNIKVHKESFEAFRNRIEKSLGFQINLKKPYKLVDYKPTYGIVLKEILAEYEFWGYSDIDLIFGDLSHFLTTEVLNSFDKIYTLGHFCLYRNNNEINNVFKNDVGMDYKKVFTSDIIHVFDETKGIQVKFDYYNIDTYKKRDFFDINPWRYNFFDSIKENSKLNSYFFWDKGKLYQMNDIGVVKELVYVHFQKRAMSININKATQKFYIYPEGVYDNNNNIIKPHSFYSHYCDLKFSVKHQTYIWVRRLKKYILKR